MADQGQSGARPAGWKKDPTGRHFGRWWDGAQWTENVISAEKVQSVDPLSSRPEPSIFEGKEPAPARPPAAPPAAGRSAQVRSKTRRGPGWRPMTWVVVVFNVLMVLWLVSGLSTVADSCEGEIGDALEACEAGTAIGAGIGVAIIIFVWAAGDVILGVIWLVTRKSAPTSRACPLCGTGVPVGQVVCGGCGYDYRTNEQGPMQPKPGVIVRRKP